METDLNFRFFSWNKFSLISKRQVLPFQNDKKLLLICNEIV